MIVVDGFGPPSRARFDDVPMPPCRERDVLIEVRVAGVNPVDWKECEGHLEQFYGAYDGRWVPGYDAAGIVHAVGAKVSAFSLVPDPRCRCDPDRGADRLPGAPPCGQGSAPVGRYRPRPRRVRRRRQLHVPIREVRRSSHRRDMQRPQCGLREGAGRRSGHRLCPRPIAQVIREWEADALDAIIDCVSGGSIPAPEDILKKGGRLISIATLTQDGDIAGDTEKVAKRGYSKIVSIMEFDRIRAFVTKRKISGGTVSEAGRIARDTMIGLLKTCAKLGISFYRFLGCRFAVPNAQHVPWLPDLVCAAPA